MMLNLTELCGFGSGAGLGKQDSAYITTVASGTSALEHTYTNVDIGKPDSSRIVVVVTQHYSVSPATTGITVGGSAMTLAKQNLSSTALGEVSIWYLAYPTGTTADIVVTKGGSNSVNITSVYALYGMTSSTPDVTSESDADPAVLSANITAGSFGIGAARTYLNSANNYTWVGLTEDYDNNPVSNNSYSVASQYLNATESPRTITADYASTGSGHYCAVFAAWK